MELIVNKSDRNKVFTFEGGLGDLVWEPDPVKRFNFKIFPTNEHLKGLLEANVPLSGIVFEGIPYIGTNDGFIYFNDKKVQRIPEIIVDATGFIDWFSFKSDEEKMAFQNYKEKGVKALNLQNRSLIQRIIEIDGLFNLISNQEEYLYSRYLSGYLGIRGFAIQKDSHGEKCLYDGHLLGISKTKTGGIINNLTPLCLHQLDSSRAVFVPMGLPPRETSRIILENGIERNEKVFCVDYRSLWNLTGQGKYVDGICPRDGSGYAAAKFATDGKMVGVSHGDHPWYALDLFRISNEGVKERIQSIDLDPSKIPYRLLISDSMVLGDYGNCIKNFSKDKEIFQPRMGKISSILDSGLCTVQDDNHTAIYDFLKSRVVEELKGDYVFLEAAPMP